MLVAIDFNAEPGRWAVEIEDVGSGGVLAAEAQAVLLAAECGPQQAFGKGGVAAEGAGAVERLFVAG